VSGDAVNGFPEQRRAVRITATWLVILEHGRPVADG
jgi:hypothetical protein